MQCGDYGSLTDIFTSPHPDEYKKKYLHVSCIATLASSTIPTCPRHIEIEVRSHNIASAALVSPKHSPQHRLHARGIVHCGLLYDKHKITSTRARPVCNDRPRDKQICSITSLHSIRRRRSRRMRNDYCAYCCFQLSTINI